MPLHHYSLPPVLGSGARIGVLIVAYNAASTVASVLDRLPMSFRARVDQVMLCDDASQDSTYLVGLGYRTLTDLPLSVVRHPQNLGYGGNQKAGYRWAIDHGLDIVVMLHGDGQYAPEVIEDLIRPLEEGWSDAVFGSRMMDRKSARKGRMPFYKYFGNRILTRYENALAGMDLSEWHSGYRAYRVDALRDIAFETNSNGFDFDTEIILQLHDAGRTIHEVPIPTYYGDEICYVNGMKYAHDVIADVTRYRLHRLGFRTSGPSFSETSYELKQSPSSSHGLLLEWMSKRPPSRVLDVGCSDGRFGALLRQQGHHVTGVDVAKHDNVGENLDAFIEADLNEGLPQGLDAAYDVVIAADVLEHTVDPHHLLTRLLEVLAPRGAVLVSIPNFAHWYPRLRVVLGLFDYDRRGILDSGHLRFFTRSSFERLVRRTNLDITRRGVVGLPVEVLGRGGPAPERITRVVAKLDRAATAVRPTLFGYQLLYELRPIRNLQNGFTQHRTNVRRLEWETTDRASYNPSYLRGHPLSSDHADRTAQDRLDRASTRSGSFS
jgi:glycosyltransferase involved in cell wall biosynthesis